MRARFHAALIALSMTSLAVIPCAEAQMRMRGRSKVGRILFNSPSAGRNGLACINCHANFDEEKSDDGKLRAGHPLINAAKRQTWWGQDPEVDNMYPDIAHAAVVCVEMFMLNPDKLTAQQLLDLQSHLHNITRQPIKAPLPLAPAVDKTGEYGGFDGGDKIIGRELFLQPAIPVIPTATPVSHRRFPEIKIPPFTLAKSVRAMASARS